MKKLLLLILPLLAVTFNSCSKNDDGGDVIENKVTFNEQTYDFTSGEMYYYGNEYSQNSTNIDLALGLGGGMQIYFEMLVPNGNTKLVAGTYTLNESSYAAFTFLDSGIEGYANEEEYLPFINGTVKIAISGDIYTITINCTHKGGGTVKGTYKGKLSWSDSND